MKPQRIDAVDLLCALFYFPGLRFVGNAVVRCWLVDKMKCMVQSLCDLRLVSLE